MTFRLVLAVWAVLYSATSVTAQNVLASTDGLVANAPAEAQRSQDCPTTIIVQATEPRDFFDAKQISQLIAAIRISRTDGCSASPRFLKNFVVRGFHEGHFLDQISIDQETGEIVANHETHPIFRSVAHSAELERIKNNIARSFEGKPDSEKEAYLQQFLQSEGGKHLNPPSFDGDFADFPYLPDRWYKLQGGGYHPNTRYTDIRTNLAGKTYLFYEYIPRERYKTISLEDRTPVAGITIAKDSVRVFSADREENITYDKIQTYFDRTHKKQAIVSCFVSEIIGSEECLLVLRTEEKERFFQQYFLAFVAPDVKSVLTKDGMQNTTRYDFDTLGYLKETSLEIAQAELDITSQLEEIARLQDEQDIREGRPKQNISFTSAVNSYTADRFRNVYLEKFREKTSIPLERSYGDYGEDQDALNREEIFVGYHQTKSFACLANEESPRKIFSFVDTSALDSANRQLTSSGAFVRFLSQPIGVAEEFFEAYEAIASLHLLKVHFNYESYRQDFSFRRTLQSAETGLQNASVAASELIAKEGCGSPTLIKFEENLLKFAYTDADKRQFEALR